ncbi:MAG TPA: molybdopterin molybdotransferase MoeA [Pseudonocardiaceae bacterium]|nr:molybdopterin molybdotransferase MoeA [Pseudonocardiaceae bacterium]
MASASITSEVSPVSTNVPWPQARELAHAAPTRLSTHPVPLAKAAGLTLAEEVRTALPMPAFDTAAMDGYAIAGPGPWQVRGVVRAGAVWTGTPLNAGEAVEISTGAPVPAGAQSVLPVEHSSTIGDLVHGNAPAPGRHIRRAGEDAPAGACLAPPGVRIGPALLGLAASCGYDVLAVRPKPRIRVLITGDELAASGQPGPGRIRDALGPLLPPLFAALDADLVDLQHIPDHPADSLAESINAARDADVVVVTGSTSVGATDRLRPLLRAPGVRWVVDQVACRPGHPQLLAGLPDGPWLAGLPGNPYAALVAAHTLLAPLLAGLTGRRLPVLPKAPLTGNVRVAPGCTRLIPVVWDGTAVRVAEGYSAAFLRGAALGDALAVIAPDWTDGAPVALLPLAD